MNWQEIAPALVALFTAIARDPDVDGGGAFSAEWKEGVRGFTSPEQKLSLLLKVTALSKTGQDETRYAYDADRGGLVATQCGIRKITLQVTAIVPERTEAHWAMATIDRVTTGLGRQSSIDALAAVGGTMLSTAGAVKASFKDSGRIISAATMDVFLSFVINDTDPSVMGWIETIELTSHLKLGDDEIAAQMSAETLP